MITLRYARQTRGFLFTPTAVNAAAHLLFSTSTTIQPYALSSSGLFNSGEFRSETNRSEVAQYFREWFMSRKVPLFDQIFEILRTQESSAVDSALSPLKLYLTESLILDVLRYDESDVLSSLKFFDWAGRQPGFHHTRSTFNAMFKLLSKAKLMSVMLDFLDNYKNQRYCTQVRYYNILVIGYAIAGKCDTALISFGKMRFRGVDLDLFSYHVLLNALVEHEYFDVAEMVAKDIKDRGFQNEITHSIMMKSFCKRNELERAAEYLHNLAEENSTQLNGIAVGTYVDALCKRNQFESAGMFIEEFRKKCFVSMEHAYSVMIRDLVIAGKLNGALEFLKDKQAVEGYVPGVFRYNMLLSELLRENRIEDMFDLLVEMKENEIVPDNVTMNSILCLLCKVGRMDIALELYNSRADFGLSVSYMAYNYLINTLVGGVSVDEAYRVLRNSLELGFVPGKKTFSIIADALCREGRLDTMKELVLFAVNQNIMPNSVAYDKFVSALCKARRVDEGYLMHDILNRLNVQAKMSTYLHLINAYIKSGRADVVVGLFNEFLEKKYRPGRRLIRGVIHSLLKADNPEDQFFKLLEVLLKHRHYTSRAIYNFFIDGAGRAGNLELAVQAYELMESNGVLPSLSSSILLMRGYLMRGKVVDALHLFRGFCTRWNNRRLWRTMVVGLCKIRRPEYAAQIMDGMRAKQLRPSIECYEELVKAYCELDQYHKAIDLVNDMTQMGRPISSFVGNVFLLHALRSRKLYNTWAHLSHRQNLTHACWMLGHTIGVFSGAIQGCYDEGDLEQIISQCFHINTYTNNMLLRRMILGGVDRACEHFNKLLEQGYTPNRWTYDLIFNGLARDGRTEEARKWMEEMLEKGLHRNGTAMRTI